MDQKKYIILLGSILVFLSSCADKSNPNYQYFPNMYQSVGYETYTESSAFNNGMEAQIPVKGTVKRGWMPFEYGNTTEDYERAKIYLKNPLLKDSLNISEHKKKGKTLYDIYCSVCHGSKGDGQGVLVKREKFLGVPNYKDRDITQGSIYHTIYYGKNAMGSHAGQLDEKERWQVVLYVEELRNKLIK